MTTIPKHQPGAADPTARIEIVLLSPPGALIDVNVRIGAQNAALPANVVPISRRVA